MTPPVDTAVEAVLVTAQRPGITALSTSILDTPQTITVISQGVMADQGVNSLQDALKTVPGVTLNAGEGGAHGDTINLRGFSASDDFFLDGLRDTGFYTRDSFDLEAVEVYKGPASTLIGRGSTGGVVNQVTRTPTLARRAELAITGGTNAEARGTLDIDQPLGEQAAIRLDAMAQRSGVAGRPHDLNRRWGVAPSIAVGLGRPTTVTLGYLHQAEDNRPDTGVPFLGHVPARVPACADFGLPADDRTAGIVDVVTLRLRHRFSDAVELRQSLRWGRYDFVSRLTEPHYGDVAPMSDADLAGVLVYRDRPSVDGVTKTAMSDTQMTWRVATGPLVHSLVAGVELDEEILDQRRFANQLDQIAPTPLLHPDPNEAFPGHQTILVERPATRTRTVSGMVGDTVDWGSHWTLSAAVRVDRFDARYGESVAGTHLSRVDVIASPRAALTWKPTPAASVYVSYGQSYNPSAESLSLSTTTADLAPERDRTFELGAKLAVLGRRLALSGAVFDTRMENARVIDPVTQTQSLAGTLAVTGVEIGASGYLTRRLEIQAGYTWLDARTIASLTPAQIGRRLPNTARNQGSLWTTYEPTEETKAGIGVTWLGRRAADAEGAATIPGYVTLDAMAQVRLSARVDVRLNAYNLTDTRYFSGVYYADATENHAVPGAGRTVNLTATVRY
jgi:catecholate siderophore receptor